MTRWFKGIDFAGERNIGACHLEVEKNVLVPHIGTVQCSIERTGIDCPFGTSLAFSRLLQYQSPCCQSEDYLKTRRTERWLREHLWGYRTSKFWQEHVADNPQCYVNKTGHVQATVRLEIVPGFLNWFRQQVGDGQFEVAIKAARRGEIAYVEAHPRAFLHSAVERIWCGTTPVPIDEHDLRAVARYKDKRRESHALERRATYRLLQNHIGAWLGSQYSLADPPDTLLGTDHAFDAWLSALTAFAHTENLTITWQCAGITDEEIDTEGHILVLRQATESTHYTAERGR